MLQAKLARERRARMTVARLTAEVGSRHRSLKLQRNLLIIEEIWIGFANTTALSLLAAFSPC